MNAHRPSATVPDDRPRLRTVLTLREVSERLGLPLTTVASIEQRALRKLAACEELMEAWEEV